MKFKTHLFIMSWVAILLMACATPYIVSQEENNKRIVLAGGMIEGEFDLNLKRGHATIVTPNAQELQKLVVGDRILIKEKNQINELNLQYVDTKTKLARGYQELGAPLSLYGKEVKIIKTDHLDWEFPIAIDLPGTNSHMWIEPEVVAEITFLVKTKEPRIIRRAYARYKTHKQRA